jgi:hypothetical protein
MVFFRANCAPGQSRFLIESYQVNSFLIFVRTCPSLSLGSPESWVKLEENIINGKYSIISK